MMASSLVLLGVFFLLLTWSIRQGMMQKPDTPGAEIAEELSHHSTPLRNAVLWLIFGLLLLIVSSRILVWGAVEFALGFGVSDLIIGLTIIVTIGTPCLGWHRRLWRAGTDLPSERRASPCLFCRLHHPFDLNHVHALSEFSQAGTPARASD